VPARTKATDVRGRALCRTIRIQRRSQRQIRPASQANTQQQRQQQQQQVAAPSDATEEPTADVTEEPANDVVTNVIYDKETLSWKQKPSKDLTVEGTLRWNQSVRGESFGAFHGQLPDRILHTQNMKRQRDLEVDRCSKRRTEDRPDHLPAEDDARNHQVPGGAPLYQVEAQTKQKKIALRVLFRSPILFETGV
jgi:hypothetical protein